MSHCIANLIAGASLEELRQRERNLQNQLDSQKAAMLEASGNVATLALQLSEIKKAIGPLALAGGPCGSHQPALL